MRVREGMQEDYARLHDAQNLWPSIIEACQSSGLHNYSGFIGGPDGRTVFAYFEADDPWAALRKLGETPANTEWQLHMAPFLESEIGFTADSVMFLEGVYHIE